MLKNSFLSIKIMFLISVNPRLTKGGLLQPPYGFSPVALKR